MLTRILPIAALLLLTALPARADAVKDCNQREDSALRIRGCTDLLERGGLTTADEAAALTNRAEALSRTGEHRRALVDYDKAVGLRPDAKSYSNRGGIRVALGDVDGAVQDLKAAIGIDPGYADAHHNLGYLLLQQGRHMEALASFDNALAADPNVRGSRVIRMRLRCALGMARGAMEDFDAGVKDGAISALKIEEVLVGQRLMSGPPTGDMGPEARRALATWIGNRCP